MTNSRLELIRQFSAPLTPLETEVEAKLPLLSSIRCVMFDIYGTLFISGSGDVGTADENRHENAFRQALHETGVTLPEGESLSPLLREAIRTSHETGRAAGIDYPEVEIREVWQDVLDKLGEMPGVDVPEFSQDDREMLSLRYELLTNPVWPMPNARETLWELKQRGLPLGIISNAQFYTRYLFEALLHESMDSLGFYKSLRIFSYESRRAKPGPFLYETAREKLAELSIMPDQVLYVGNDMLKDVYPASLIGFRTALFAGDARSLRLREDDERMARLEPDVILTDMAQLTDCLKSH